jgi:hypothetical protein
MLNEFIYKKLHQNYVSSFNPKEEKCPIHERHLNALRSYLDVKGYKMPKPKWKVDYKDLTTWPYLPGYIDRDDKKNPICHVHHINQHFRFKHLL